VRVNREADRQLIERSGRKLLQSPKELAAMASQNQAGTAGAMSRSRKDQIVEQIVIEILSKGGRKTARQLMQGRAAHRMSYRPSELVLQRCLALKTDYQYFVITIPV
jgi:hypothetical protein